MLGPGQTLPSAMLRCVGQWPKVGMSPPQHASAKPNCSMFRRILVQASLPQEKSTEKVCATGHIGHVASRDHVLSSQSRLQTSQVNQQQRPSAQRIVVQLREAATSDKSTRRKEFRLKNCIWISEAVENYTPPACFCGRA